MVWIPRIMSYLYLIDVKLLSLVILSSFFFFLMNSDFIILVITEVMTFFVEVVLCYGK